MLQAGTRLQDKYVIDQVLGRGGMGAVYRARQVTLGDKPVAIKEMIISLDDPAERQLAVRQFEQEAYILARLQHPNLVDVFDHFEQNGHQYLVMALVEGQSLEDVLNDTEGLLPVWKVMTWAEELCDVLDYMHNQPSPVIFRDLKPTNIMLDRRGHIRLIDFGIARLFTPGTKTSTFIKGAGTPGFAPAEQFGSGKTDARSDVYALGCTLYTLLTKTIPPLSVEMLSGDAELVPPRTLNSQIPVPLETAILKMMGLRKDDRYPSIAEARQALAVARTALSGPAPEVCGKCQKPLPPGAPSCPTCYPVAPAQVPPSARFCPHCGRPTDVRLNFCADCGGRLSLTPPTQQPPVTPPTPVPARPSPLPPTVMAPPPATTASRPAWLLPAGAVGLALVLGGLFWHPGDKPPATPSPSPSPSSSPAVAVTTPTATYTVPTPVSTPTWHPPPPVHPAKAMERDISTQYNAANAALRAGNLELYQSFMAPEYRSYYRNGTSASYAQVSLINTKIFHRLIGATADTRIVSFRPLGQTTAVATVRFHSHIVFRGDDGRQHTLDLGGSCRDTWALRVHGWKMTRSDEIAYHNLFDGGPLR